MSNGFTLAILLLLSITIVGCGDSGDAIEQRAQEFQYSVDSLGTELVKRLKDASAAKARSAADSERGADIRELEADRGGDGGRPDPNSVDAIIADAAVKVTKVGGATAAEATQQLITLVSKADGISSAIKKEFETGLMAALNTK